MHCSSDRKKGFCLKKKTKTDVEPDSYNHYITSWNIPRTHQCFPFCSYLWTFRRMTLSHMVKLNMTIRFVVASELWSGSDMHHIWAEESWVRMSFSVLWFPATGIVNTNTEMQVSWDQRTCEVGPPSGESPEPKRTWCGKEIFYCLSP